MIFLSRDNRLIDRYFKSISSKKKFNRLRKGKEFELSVQKISHILYFIDKFETPTIKIRQIT